MKLRKVKRKYLPRLKTYTKMYLKYIYFILRILQIHYTYRLRLTNINTIIQLF